MESWAAARIALAAKKTRTWLKKIRKKINYGSLVCPH